MDAIQRALESIGQRFDTLETTLGTRFATVEQVKTAVEQAYATLGQQLEQKQASLVQALQAQFETYERRFEEVESPSGSPLHRPTETTTSSYVNLHKKSKGFTLTLDKYSGRPGVDLQTWILQVEDKCRLQNIDPSEIGLWAKVHLEGNALQYVTRLGLSDWNTIKDALSRQFVPKSNNQFLRMRLSRLRQQGDIHQYVLDFQSIVNKITDSMTDGDRLFYFMAGLLDKCKRYVELQEPSTFQEAVDSAVRFEHVHTASTTQPMPMDTNKAPFKWNRSKKQNKSYGKSNYGYRKPWSNGNQNQYGNWQNRPAWQNQYNGQNKSNFGGNSYQNRGFYQPLYNRSSGNFQQYGRSSTPWNGSRQSTPTTTFAGPRFGWNRGRGRGRGGSRGNYQYGSSRANVYSMVDAQSNHLNEGNPLPRGSGEMHE